MEKRTLLAVVAFVLLGAGAFLALRAPDKGQHVAHEPPVPVMKADEITKLELTSQKGEQTVLEKSADGWHITAPKAWPADANALSTLTTAIGKLTFADIVTESPTKHKDLGVDDQSTAKIKITSPKGTADLILGNTVGGFQMVRLAGKNEVWQSNNLFLYQINKPTKDWRDHSIAPITIAAVDHLTVDDGTNKLVLERNADMKSWKVVESTGNAPKATDVLDDSQPATVAQAIGSMRAADFADDKSPKDAGLEPPQLTVTVTAAGKATGIELGALDGDDRYVRVVGHTAIYKVKKYLLERIEYLPADYRDKTLLAVKDAAKIVVVNGKVTTTLVRGADKWALEPTTGPVDEGKVKAFAGGVESLVGTSLVFDKTANTGLAKPRATITVTPKSGTAQVVNVGAPAAGGLDYFAQNTGSKEVVLVKKFAIDRLLKSPSDFAPSPKGSPAPHMPPGMVPPGMPH